MFKIRKHDEPIPWPVKISVPLPGGKVDAEGGFTAHFQFIDTDKVDEISRKPDAEYISTILVGWDGVVDEDGEPVPFSVEARDAMAKNSYIKAAIFAAFWEMMTGREAKNS